MVRPENILGPGEEVRGEWRVKGYRLVVTDRRLLVSKGRRVQDIGLQHIVAVEVEEKWSDVIAGIVLVLLGVFIAGAVGALGAIFIIIGLAAAVWGYLNRYVLVVSYGAREFKVKNGSSLIEIAQRLREHVVRVRQA